jgi:hypothetical protein
MLVTPDTSAIGFLSEEDLRRGLGLARPRRMLLIITALWLTNLFDVGLTLMAHSQGILYELNPVVVWLLGVGPQAGGLYKVAMVVVGTSLLWRVRRHALAELAAWTMLFVYVLVAMHWQRCYESFLALEDLQHVIGAGSYLEA